jgi:hypothetical protein
MSLKNSIRKWLEIPEPEPVLFPVSVDVFIGNNHKNDEFEYCEGYLRGNILTVFFAAPKEAIADENGVLYFRPLGLDEYIRAAGYQNYVTGSSYLEHAKGHIATGGALWDSGNIFLLFGFGEKSDRHVAYVNNDADIAWPFRMYYGIKGQLTIMVP